MRNVIIGQVCEICGDTAVARCSWPVVEKPIEIRPSELVPGDLILFGDKIVPVVSVSPSSDGRLTNYTLKGVDRKFGGWFDAYVTAMREAPCGVICCDAHVMDRGGPDHCVCQSHWFSWELSGGADGRERIGGVDADWPTDRPEKGFSLRSLGLNGPGFSRKRGWPDLV